jgi:hypothetical protein
MNHVRALLTRIDKYTLATFNPQPVLANPARYR